MTGNRLTDDEVRRWFARDRTTELRTQLLRVVERLVALGVLKEGDQVPPIKHVAKLVDGIYPSALFYAYGRLKELGVLRGEHGRGFFVADPTPAREVLAREALGRAIYYCRHLGLAEDAITRAFREQIVKSPTKKTDR